VDEPHAIQTMSLGKTFGRGRKRIHAVKALNLEVPAGQIYGFLGPNGAGKTTTIRMLTGLIRPSQGEVLVYGRLVRRHQNVLRRVGAIVEHASFYPFLSGRGNLEVLARSSGGCDAQRIMSLLDQVGLARHAEQRVGGYSTGMRQRLGLVATLLHNPDLLILDEPTGGLDPAGIHEVRLFLRDLVDRQGKTVFVSSHLLAEVEQVCDRVAIIHHGEIVHEGPVADVVTAGSNLRVEASPLEQAAGLLQRNWPTSQHEGWLMVDALARDVPQVVRRLVENAVDVHQVIRQRQTLEDLFLDITQPEV
jgi:ABC-2 type transport system ATP-binding protein